MSSVRWNSWVFPTLLCVGLSIVYMVEWRSSRDEQRANVAAFADALRGIDTKFGVERAETRSFTSKTRESLDALVANQAAILAALNDGAPKAVAALELSEVSEPEVDGQTEDKDSLVLTLTDAESVVFPEVPKGMNPVHVVESFEFGDLVENVDLNPNDSKLSELGYRRAANLITHAKARLSTVTSDLHLLISEEKENLLEQGIFVDYAKGQRIEQMKDVATLGEIRADGGMRIFPFYSEDYPRVYELREEKKKIASGALRRFMMMLNEGG